jgi:hypothetical protein
MRALPDFKRGDLVQWSSQGRGSWRHHTGIVVLVLPGGVPIESVWSRMATTYSMRAMLRSRGSRPEKSYLVARLGARGVDKAPLHWPHASLLKPY